MLRKKLFAAAASAMLTAIMPICNAQDASDPFSLSRSVTSAYAESGLPPAPDSQGGFMNDVAQMPVPQPAQVPSRRAVMTYADDSYAPMTVSGPRTGNPTSIPRMVQTYPVGAGLQSGPNAPQSIDPSIYMTAPQSVPQQSGYVRLGAPLYPSPRPNIPIWSGGAMITNPAFAPHEMMYPHTYRAMYGPFYHRVRGSWIWTPFGIRSHERWELQGTQVEVSYRAKPPLFTHFNWHPPVQSRPGIGSRY